MNRSASTAHRAHCLLASLLIPLAGGCAAFRANGPTDRNEPPGPQLGRQIDITGSFQRNEDIGDAAQAVRERVEQLDPYLLNETLAEITVLMREIRARVIAIPEDAGQKWADTIDAARIESLSTQLHDLTDQATATISAVDPRIINDAITEFRDVVGQLADKIETLDVAAANVAIADLADLTPAVGQSISETRALASEIRQTVESLPVAQVKTSLTQIEHAGAAVAPALHRLVTILWVFLAGLALAVIWFAVWLGRAINRDAA